LDEEMSTRKDWVRRVNNSFWLAHRVFNSRAKVVYGTVYDIPEDIGRFDICTFGSILLHLRDPFLALQCATAHVDGTAIVTDVPIFPIGSDPVFNLLARHRFARFLPDAAARKPGDAWWNLSPALVSEFLRVLGFPYTKTTLHRQRYYGREIELYTVVGRRVAERDAAATDGEEGHEPIAFESEDRAGLEKTALDYMPFSRIAEYLVKRGWDAVGKRVFGRR
jgi:hypothetical protein